MIECEKCKCKISPFDLPEHLDFHLAKELQDEFRKSETTIRTTAPSVSLATSSNTKKRKNDHSNDTESKKQKSISSFFIKK